MAAGHSAGRWAVVLLWVGVQAVAADEAEDKAAELQASTWQSLVENVLSYAIAVVPVAFLVHWLRKNPDKIAGDGPVQSILRNFVAGEEIGELPTKDAGSSGSGKESQVEPFLTTAAKMGFCVVGLQGSYLTWGVLQERIMTQSYGVDENGEEVFFRNSQFLVFINRILALVSASIILRATSQPRHGTPLYKYSFASMSNVLSSWCQYEALKYVNFPTQVLAKACKIIPVMLMGKLVQNKTYPAWEYGIATMLSFGVTLFMFSKAETEGKMPEEAEEEATSMVGLLLLVGYMFFDSFTSNYQTHLFKTYKMSSYSMMFGVNLFSTFFTLWSLVQQGTFFPAVDFLLSHQSLAWQALLLSITSATGQLFIFRTLSQYGALVFAIIMTTRQVFSIFLSAMIFGHSFAAQGWVGIFVCFTAMFLRIYFRTTAKK